MKKNSIDRQSAIADCISKLYNSDEVDGDVVNKVAHWISHGNFSNALTLVKKSVRCEPHRTKLISLLASTAALHHGRGSKGGILKSSEKTGSVEKHFQTLIASLTQTHDPEGKVNLKLTTYPQLKLTLLLIQSVDPARRLECLQTLHGVYILDASAAQFYFIRALLDSRVPLASMLSACTSLQQYEVLNYFNSLETFEDAEPDVLLRHFPEILETCSEASLVIAELLSLRSSYRKAIECLHEAIKKFGLLPRHVAALSEQYLARGHPRFAERLITFTLMRCETESKRDTAILLTQRAKCKIHYRDYNEAAADLDLVDQTMFKSPSVQHLRGLIALLAVDEREALEVVTGSRLAGYSSLELSSLECDLRFKVGDLSVAWDLYARNPGQLRRRAPRNAFHYLSSTEIVRGVSLPLLVVGEQGVGDQILLSRLLKRIKPSMMGVTLAVDPRVAMLKLGLPSEMRIISWDSSEFNTWTGCYCYLSELPRFFPEVTRVTPHLSDEFLSRVTSPKRIGLAWRSSGSQVGPDKSIKLMRLIELFSEFEKECELIPLQYDFRKWERQIFASMMGKSNKAFEDLDLKNDLSGVGNLISSCELIITISNTVAHLAGLTTTPTLLLLPKQRGLHWYWAQPTIGAWYPNVIAVRQHTDGDWTHPLQQVKNLLER